MSREKHLRVKEKLDNIIKDNCNQYCYNCKHTLYFNPREAKKNCDYCGTLNKNKTRAYFRYNFYQAKQKMEDYKIIKLEEK